MPADGRRRGRPGVRPTGALRLAALLTLLPAAPMAAGAQAWATRLTSEPVAFDPAAEAPAGWRLAPYPRERYTGADERGVPRYVGGVFTAEERRLLRAHFGIESPERLYVSALSGYLTYDTRPDGGAGELVNSFRVGGISARKPSESWEEFEQRVRAAAPADFPPEAFHIDSSLDALHRDVRGQFKRMVAAARRAGFDVHVRETYRSPTRQAYLLGRHDGSTYTGTSTHSDGRAADIVVGDGNLRHRKTRARWIAFRRWVERFDRGQFTIIGTPDRSWDWPHVAIVGDQPGFTSIEELLEAARVAEGTGPVAARSAPPPDAVRR